MKTHAIKFVAVALLLFAAAATDAQPLLLDSLKGTWTMSEQYKSRNKDRVETKGTIEFREDGTFHSVGSYFGTTTGLYRTDETKSTIHIEIDGITTEWNAAIRNHILHMVKPKGKKSPRVELVLMAENAEVNNSGS
jgi:hypothetical protein